MSSLDNTLDAIIDIEQRVCMLQLSHHRGCEGIVLLRPVQRNKLNRRDLCGRLRHIGDFDFRETNVCIASRDGDFVQ